MQWTYTDLKRQPSKDYLRLSIECNVSKWVRRLARERGITESAAIRGLLKEAIRNWRMLITF